MSTIKFRRILLAGLSFVILMSACATNVRETKGTTQMDVAVTEETEDSTVTASETIEQTGFKPEKSYTETVFGDTLAEPFKFGTWGDAEFSADTADPVKGGSRSIFVRLGSWQAFEFFRRSENWEEIYYMYPNRYRSVTFTFNPGESVEDDRDLVFSLDKDVSVPLFDLIDGEPAPDTWYELTVMLLKVNPEEEPMSRLVFFNKSEGSAEFYIDEVRLNCRDDFTSPVLSRVSVEVGSAGTFATIRFSTSERTKAELFYGIGESSETVMSDGYLTEHELIVNHLVSGEKYRYDIVVTDYPGGGDMPGNETTTSGTFVAVPNYGMSSFVAFTVDTTVVNGEISPYIYGRNFFDPESFESNRYTLGRLGGNRWTAYNWENNASNAGGDWYFHNDAYLSASDDPAAAVTERVSAIFKNGAAALVTVPIQGYVAKDKNGTDVRETEDYLDERFLENLAFHPGGPDTVPDRKDNFVFQNEFVRFLERAFPTEEGTDRRLFYCLDNEPALWASTHEAIQREPVSYKEVADKNIEFAQAIKSAAPKAEVFGFVGYGYNAFINLQDAPDSRTNGVFIDYYLKRMAKAEREFGKRLVDVLDIHWYPEAKDNPGNRITSESGDAEIARARVQAPRSLWDDGYIENSWITDVTGEPVCLLPWLFEKIDKNYPGTKLAISEYYFGGSNHISGGIAQADFLGIIGREGVFAATLWPMGGVRDSYIEAAFDMYLNYDGNGSHFGDISVLAETDDFEGSSVYASLFSDDPDKMVIIAINKTNGWTQAMIDIKSSGNLFRNVDTFLLSEAYPDPERIGSFEAEAEMLTVDLAPNSVTCLVLTR